MSHVGGWRRLRDTAGSVAPGVCGKELRATLKEAEMGGGGVCRGSGSTSSVVVAVVVDLIHSFFVFSDMKLYIFILQRAPFVL